MKRKLQAKDIWLFVAQVLLLSLIMLSPALISYISSNGDGYFIRYRENCGPKDSQGQPITVEERDLDHFPTNEEIWACYKRYKGIESSDAETIASQDYFYDSEGDRKPRYYQQIAINRTVEAIAKGQNRILLVMATGTGKTYTAFQIIYRLWKSGWTRNKVPGKTPRNR